MNLPFFPCTGFLLPIEHGGLSFAACWSGLRAGQAGLQCPWGGSLGEADSDTTRFTCPNTVMGFPNGSDRKESACNGGDPGSIPVWGRSTREGNGNPLQYSCLENSMDREAWRATVHGVVKSWTLLTNTFLFTFCCNQETSR